MFYNARIGMSLKMAKAKQKDSRGDSRSFEAPLYVRNGRGEYVEHYGRLGLSGFYFETATPTMVGQSVVVKIVLLGLGMELETQGRVVGVVPSSSRMGVAVRFDKIPRETAQMIIRWLDLHSNTVPLYSAA